MIEVRGLSVRAGSFVLKDISLRVERGRIHVLLGPTGSGKSTLLEALVGLRRPEEGSIFLEGREITRLPVERRGLAYLPQDLALFPHLTVEENILYGPRIRGIHLPEGFLRELLDILGIRGLLKRRPGTLSGGERQRVALARALAPGSRYLLLDEPFSALHAGLRRELWFLLRDLKERFDLAVLLVTHDLEEAFFLGDTVSVLIDGRLEQSGSREEVFHHPAGRRVAAFFGIKNLFEGRVLGAEKGILRVEVPVLKRTLVVRSRISASPGETLGLGIRPEHILFLRPKYRKPHQNNLLPGRIVALHPRGTGWWVLFRPRGSEVDFEVELPDYAFEKLSLREGVAVEAVLPEEKLFAYKE